MDTKTIFIGLSTLVSFSSLVIAIKSYRFTKEKNEKDRELEYSNYLIENSKKYVDLYNSELKKTKENTDNFSHLLVKTNIKIGELFDFFQTKTSSKHLSHIYDEVIEDIEKNFDIELSYQTTENIYDRLARFKNINLNIDKEITFIDNTFLSKKIYENLQVLENSISQKDQLYTVFIAEMHDFIQYHTNILAHVKESIKNLENGLSDNKIETFNFQENYKAYKLYKQLLLFLKYIEQTRIPTLIQNKEVPYLPISQILYIGANLKIINEVLLRVYFNYWK